LTLFECYQQLPEKKYPDSKEELEPLYRAVVHGCLAGEFQKALYEVYRGRIDRGSEGYSSHKLGLYSDNLTALAAFFPQGWSQPIQQGLSEADQAWLLAEASFCLMSLGRLVEAIEPRKADLKIAVKIEDWKGASITAQNLVDLLLPLGRLTEAVTAAQQAIDYAEKDGDLFEQMGSQAYLGMVLHRVGKLTKSQHHFEQAEQLQIEDDPEYPQLYSLRGFNYCGLLLDQATDQTDLEKVVKRGEYSLKLMQENNWLMDIALDQLTLARATFKLDRKEEAERYFNQAVESIRKAGKIQYLPIFLLEQAGFYVAEKRFEEGLFDAEEAKQEILRGGMKLYEVDYDLLMCNYYQLTANQTAFKTHLEHAKCLVEETHYDLRKPQLERLSAS